MTKNSDGLLIYGFKYEMINGEQVPGADLFFSPPFLSVVVNWGAATLVQLGFNFFAMDVGDDDKRTWDRTRRDDELKTGWRAKPRLTAAVISNDYMAKTVEPLLVRKGQIAVALAVVMTVVGLPWYDSAYTVKAVHSGMISTSIPYLIIWVASSGCTLYATSLWVSSDEYELAAEHGAKRDDAEQGGGGKSLLGSASNTDEESIMLAPTESLSTFQKSLAKMKQRMSVTADDNFDNPLQNSTVGI